MNFIRWLLATVFVSAFAMVYSLLFGLASGVLFPGLVRDYHGLHETDPVVEAALQSALEWGLFLSLLMGPFMALTLVRDFNASIEHPDHEKGWWKSIVRNTARSFLVIAASGIVLGGLVASLASVQGGGHNEIQRLSFLAAVFGQGVAALVVSIGHFVRNPPEWGLGSDRDNRPNPD